MKAWIYIPASAVRTRPAPCTWRGVRKRFPTSGKVTCAPCRNSASEWLGRCPPELVAQTCTEQLCIWAEDTARDGNCGLDAFARSLLHQMGRSPKAGGPVQCSRNRSKLKAADDKIALLRRVGLEWLEANAQEPLWPGMTVSKLCGVVSGHYLP